MIKFVDVEKTYGKDNEILKKINLEIKRGEFVFIVGSSGAGKSTLLKLMLKEENPTAGKIFLDGADITKLASRRIPFVRRQMGVVFQNFRLLDNKNVYDNVAYAMEILGEPNRIIKKQVPKVLGLMGMEAKIKSFPGELSGGEKQRVAIARAMINNPPLLIADEPTGNLDYRTSEDIMALLESINRRGTTVVMATHDRDIVDKLQKRVITLHNGRVISDEKGGYHSEN